MFQDTTMLVRCITGLALGLAVAFSLPAAAETPPAKTSLFPMKSANADEAEQSAKAKKSADAKVIKKKKDAASAKADSKKKKDVAAKKSKKDQQVASAKTKKDAPATEASTSKVEFFLWGSRAKKEQPEEPKQASLKKVPPAPVEPMPVMASGNAGELRSEVQEKPQLFSGLFGATEPGMLPETRALDSVLQAREAKKKFKVKPDFEPQSVEFSGYERGTIVIDTASRYLYLVESSSSARRYAIAVGREGLEFKGSAKVGDKQEWPRWIPTKEMQERDPKKYGQYKDGMNGGPDNPLGARAIYLYQGKKDTHIRIHGTNQPQSIGTNASNGCFRMVNDHVIDLYKRVKLGTQVIVM
ncbi:MAG: L,D-transpeptidase [Rhizobiaceae bacterium]|nr:L,D-transpeptidase [Rhizobiaceae bacterium]